MSAQISEIISAFPDFFKLYKGDDSSIIDAVAPPHSHAANALIFASDEKHLAQAIESRPSALCVSTKLANFNLLDQWDKAVLTCENPYLGMALVGQKFFPIKTNINPIGGKPIHPSACVAESAELGTDVQIGPNAVIGEGVQIGDRSIIGANTTIESQAALGNDCHIHPQVFIGHSCLLGNGVEVQPNSTIGSEGYGYAQDSQRKSHRIPHYGRVVLKDDVHIGANVSIDRGVFDDTVIGQGTKLDNHIHVGHNNKIGENCLITAGFISAGSTTIGDRFICGGRTSVNGHINLGDDIRAFALTTFSKDTPESGEYAGYPQQKYRDSIRTQASMPHLPQMRKDLNKIKKKLDID